MSSYADPWQYAQGLIDPLTGLPKKKQPARQQPSLTQEQVKRLQQSFGQNPGTFGPSPNVDYGYGAFGNFRLPGMPDYRKLIDTDPGYQQAKLDFGAQGVSDAAQRAAGTQRALGQFGYVPDATGIPGIDVAAFQQDVTPEARQTAEQNTAAGTSIIARQRRTFDDHIRSIKNALAARGALRSGESAFQLQRAQQNYDQARFDTTQELLDYIAGLQAGFVERQRQEKLRLAQEATSAESRVREAYPGQAVADGGANATIATQTTPAAPPAASVDDRSDRPEQYPSAFRNGYVDEQGRPLTNSVARMLAALGRSSRF